MLVPSFISCNEREIELYGYGHELFFDKFFINAFYPGTQESDSTTVSFFFAEDDVESIDANLIVHLSGRKLTEDLKFKLRVVEDGTTALPNEYILEDHYVFRSLEIPENATSIADTIAIKILRSKRLPQSPNGVRLVLEIDEFNDVKAGQFERSRAVIILIENAVQPLWWTREVEEYLLGKYSAKKYKLFLVNVEGAENLDENTIVNKPDQAIKYAREFKKWLLEQDPPVTEEDGSLMKVNV